MSVNRVVLIGRLTRDPEMRYSPGGTPWAKFTLAVDRDRKNDEGQREADFIDCVAFRHSAEFCASYLSKGTMAAVDGRLQQRKWQAQDGTNRTAIEVIVDRVQGLEKARQGGVAEEGQAVAKPVVPEPKEATDQFLDEEDPFGNS